MTDHRQRKARLRSEWLLTAAIALCALAILIFANIARPLGNVTYDHFMRWHGFRATQDIVIIAIDDRSLRELHGWPLKRETYAQLISQLGNERYRPKALGIDLLFLDPTSGDKALAESLKQVRAVLPLEFKIAEDAKQSYQATPPVQPLAKAAKLAHINLSFDEDGVIRGFTPTQQTWPHFALAMHALGDPTKHSQIPNQRQRFRMVDPRVGFPMVSLVDAINNDFTKTLFKDKYVLIGVTAPSLSDRYPTLYSGKNNASTPGVAILASILNASLNQALIQEASSWINFIAAAAVVLIMLQSLVILKPRQALLLTLVLILLCAISSYLWLTLCDLWIDPVPFILVALFIHPLWAWRRLEAIVNIVHDKATDLYHFPKTERDAPVLKTSREVVLQYGKLLDHAVASAKSELDFLSSIIDELPDAVAIFDNNDELLLCNQRLKSLVHATTFTGGTPISVLAQKIGLSISSITLETDATLPPTVYELPTLLGLRDFYVKSTPLTSPMGDKLRLLILSDVTELRKSQTQRDRALQFLSHDMRTPVASIMSIAHHASVEKSTREKINHHGRALLNMMDDFILTISSEAAQYKLKEELLDNIINDAVEQVRDLAIAKGIHIRDDAPPLELFVMANTRLLVRAFVNLLFNAVKFSPPNCSIVLYARHDAERNRVQISITNQVAISEITNDLSPSMPGFGLGLDFVDTVIRKHHGHIDRRIPQQGVAHISIDLPTVVHLD